MNYNSNDLNNNLIDSENNVSKVKEAINSLMNLSDQEKKAINSIENEKDLLLLINTPENYLSEKNVQVFLELKELLDLMGGIYFA